MGLIFLFLKRIFLIFSFLNLYSSSKPAKPIKTAEIFPFLIFFKFSSIALAIFSRVIFIPMFLGLEGPVLVIFKIFPSKLAKAATVFVPPPSTPITYFFSIFLFLQILCKKLCYFLHLPKQLNLGRLYNQTRSKPRALKNS